jgi:DNA-binding SARP family transcriptional activator/tetratricopeptide (TPR) repeat protein
VTVNSGRAGSAQPRIEVRVLGPFAVLADGDPVDISAGRASALLAVLAMSAGRVVSIERLTDMVWGEHPPANARRTVQTYAYRLRTALGSESIGTFGTGYVLKVHPDDVDALRFVDLLDTADRDPESERDRIVTALGLWRGDPLEGVQSEWLIEYDRPRLVERHLSALERRIDLDIDAGRAGDVIAEIGEVAGQHPLRESMWARLIVALDRCGRPAEALECYETMRSRIASELGVDPGPELQRIYADLLRGAAPEPTTRQSEPEPEPTVPRQLPADVEGFTGREDVLAALDALVDGDHSTPAGIAVVHGAGGIGKTAVAVRWAHRVSERFPDGQLYLDLRGFGPGEPTAPAQALETLLHGLGVPGEHVPAALDARSALLRTVLADRRMLMVLDNARDAEQARPLLPGGRGILVIVTSRSRMRGLTAREGARRIAVDTLPLGDAVDLLTDGLDRQRVGYDEESLTELAELAGRMPLALAVAVERASLFLDSNVAELVGELRDEQKRLDALDPGDDPLTSVRAVFSWSYQALDEEAAQTFRLLGLHPGVDIGPSAAAALIGSTRSRQARLLDRLADVNLLQRSRHGRYTMHDLLRTYAAELVHEADDRERRDSAIRRILSWYVHSAADAHAKSVTTEGEPRYMNIGVPEVGVTPLSFADHRQAHDWLDAEWPTLVRLVSYAAAQGHPRAAYHLVNELHHYLVSDRPPAEAAALQSIASESAVAVGQPIDEGFITNQLGISYGRLGDYERCIDLLERARHVFRAEQHTGGESQALHNLGIAYIGAGRLDDARVSVERALALAVRREDDIGEIAVTLANLSRLHLEAGQIDEAVEAASDALRRLSGSDRLMREALASMSLGLARAAQGRHSEAEECLVSALETYRALGRRWSEAVVLTSLGRVERDTNRPDEARATWQRALAIVDEVGELDSTDLSRAELVALLDSVPGL